MNLNVMILTVAVVAFTVVTYRLMNHLMADRVSEYVQNHIASPVPERVAPMSWHHVAYILLREHQDNSRCRGAGCPSCKAYNDYYTVHLYGDPDA